MYKVGGCVRDKILGHNSHDTDYVVVGATVDYMHGLGFIPVGRHFPVFIDPKTQIQYALARTERKTGIGYHGFEFYTAQNVTLEQDLKRRDLTINAIAEDADGQLIDPFGGISDLHHKIIRHVSPAFAEDPLRVLRVARFRASLGFSIAPETLILMKVICSSNELEQLSHERIWNEVKKVLSCQNPMEFFLVLNQVGALEHILGEFKLVAKNTVLHEKIVANLSMATELDYKPEEKFALILGNMALFEPSGVNNILQNCKLGQHYSELGYVVSRNLAIWLNLEAQSLDTILGLIKNLDPLRRAPRFEQICKILLILYPKPEYVEFLKQIVYHFRQIPYAQFQSNNPHSFELRVNSAKLGIIADTYQQFFGAQARRH